MRAIFNQGNRGKLARGFTLIELLVVIAIIGILTAIYPPVVARAKAKAKQSNCASNLQQIGLSFRVFAQDSGGRFPMNVRARYGGAMEYAAPDAVDAKREVENRPENGNHPIEASSGAPIDPLAVGCGKKEARIHGGCGPACGKGMGDPSCACLRKRHMS
jgi:prepilin-type N-terminal cleavage/methylation domain-containing protein